MFERVTKLLREYVLVISIITMIIGLIILFMGVIRYGFNDLQLGFYTDIINQLGDWNVYLLIIGIIIFGFGTYYFYSYHKNKKFVLKEIKTKKRSEFLKKHHELKDTVKHLPSKYSEMLKEKEEDLHIK